MKSFYCQYCGAQVPINSSRCHNCNKEFESVLCPKCLYSGSSIEFQNGCPSCGYLKEKPLPKKEKKVFNLTKKLFLALFTSLLVIIGILLYQLMK